MVKNINFTDLEEPNKMDVSPFLTIDITNLKDTHKDTFDIDKIASSASELKYLNKFKAFLSDQLLDPSEDFVKYFVGEIYGGVKLNKH